MIVSLLALVVALGGVGLAANGGPFLLGSNNLATAPTRLSSSAGPALKLTNTSSGETALGLFVQDDSPPLVVNSDVRVNNLNADLLDSLHANELVRVGRAFDLDVVSAVTFSARAQIAMNIPTAGFVLVNGQARARTASAACNPCFLHMQFRDQTTGDVSPALITEIGNGTATDRNQALGATWVFPVTAGARTFALETGVFPPAGAVSTDNPTMTALFVPFGPTGTKVLTGGSPSTDPKPQRGFGPVRPDGTRAAVR
jgi:hypothetical protein